MALELLNFKVGQKVKLLDEYGEGCYSNFTKNTKVGMIGTVRKIGDSNVGVDFGRDVDGHGCDGTCTQGQGHYILPYHLAIHIPQKDLKVGMVVDCGDENYIATSCWTNGVTPKKILKITEDNHITNDYAQCYCDDRDHLYLREPFGELPEPTEQLVSKPIQTSDHSEEKTKNKFMSNVIEFVKDLALSKEEKLKRKHGLKDSCGNFTETAKELAMLKLCRDNEEYFDEVAEQIEKEEKE